MCTYVGTLRQRAHSARPKKVELRGTGFLSSSLLLYVSERISCFFTSPFSIKDFLRVCHHRVLFEKFFFLLELFVRRLSRTCFTDGI